MIQLGQLLNQRYLWRSQEAEAVRQLICAPPIGSFKLGEQLHAVPLNLL